MSMVGSRFDALVGGAGDAVSRRRSLAAFGAAAVGAVAASSPATAGRSTKKLRKRAKKRADKKCKRQIGICRAVLTAACDDDPDCDLSELEEPLRCCDQFKNCRAGQALDCFFAPFLR
jgi:hypothetical protein